MHAPGEQDLLAGSSASLLTRSVSFTVTCFVHNGKQVHTVHIKAKAKVTKNNL